MGLSWSEPNLRKGVTLIVLSAPFPSNKQQSDKLWNLYKTKKEQIKNDEFSVSKDKLSGIWKIMYFHTVKETSLTRDVSGEYCWKTQFKERLKKWENILNNVNEKKSKDDLEELESYTVNENITSDFDDEEENFQELLKFNEINLK
jgi:hypothetical protein